MRVWSCSIDSQQGGSDAKMLFCLSVCLALLWTTGSMMNVGGKQSLHTLNDMFAEVEELMEDTQHFLDEAVDQIRSESAKSLSQHNDTEKAATTTMQVLNKTDEKKNCSLSWKEMTNKTEFSQLHLEIYGQWNSVAHECLVDEDCGELKYCWYEMDNSKCLPCIPTDMPCTKDEECCSKQTCVWGQCTVNATQGTEGTICQGQSDCRPDLCCAFQRELLFPVCNPKPGKGESCLNQPNLLMDMLAWDQEGPRDNCPCANNLQCQMNGRGSVCGE
ncbi:dickkopf-related protein 3b isoform X2 [Nerophis lumbriciformis]|uniref:dickkopf-related protein 3b isoform X2 n=1 Tax=Nerophis lumbriciformis TaxID=546530 RepID=UPI002AE09116|nr:dickkopf-related protein 3-like isoform X2 [Nerophis lumbriciformis]